MQDASGVEEPRIHIDLTYRHLMRLYLAAARLRQQIRQQVGLNQTEASAVELLRMSHPEPVRASQIAEFSGISRSAATKLLDSFERDGRIERRPSRSDRRATDIYLTAGFVQQIDTIMLQLLDEVGPVLGMLQPGAVAPLHSFLSDLAGTVEQYSPHGANQAHTGAELE